MSLSDLQQRALEIMDLSPAERERVAEKFAMLNRLDEIGLRIDYRTDWIRSARISQQVFFVTVKTADSIPDSVRDGLIRCGFNYRAPWGCWIRRMDVVGETPAWHICRAQEDLDAALNS